MHLIIFSSNFLRGNSLIYTRNVLTNKLCKKILHFRLFQMYFLYTLSTSELYILEIAS